MDPIPLHACLPKQQTKVLINEETAVARGLWMEVTKMTTTGTGILFNVAFRDSISNFNCILAWYRAHSTNMVQRIPELKFSPGFVGCESDCPFR